MPRARSTAGTRARWAACLVTLGAGTLSAGIAYAQQDDPLAANDLAANDPNVIRGVRLQFGMGVDETLTDNAAGTANGGTLSANSAGTVSTSAASKKGDLVSRFTPTIAAYDVTRRIQAGLTYSPSYEKFLNSSNLDRFDNTLLGTGKADLWDNRLTVNATGSISREIINAQGALAPDAITTNQNQTTVQTYTFSPTFVQPFGDFAVGQLRYLLGSTSTSSGALAPALQNQVTGSLTSGTEFNNLQWSVTLSDSETDQGSTLNGGQTVNNIVNPTTSAPLSDKTAQVGLNYALNRTITLLSGVGYEDISSSSSLLKTSGPFGSFGIGLTGSRLDLQVVYNLRYNTQFVSAQGTYNITEQLKAQVLYTESITTQQNLLINQALNLGLTPTGGFVNPVTGLPFSATPSAAGINSGAGNFAIRDRNGQFILTGNYDRNIYAFTAQQDVQSTDTTDFNEKTLSLTGTYARDLTPKTNLNLAVSYVHLSQTSPTASRDDLYTASPSLSYDLGQGLTATAAYSFLYRKSSVSGQNLSANALTLGLHKQF